MTYERDPWRNRFVQPTVAKLQSGLKEQDAKLLDRMRKHLGGIPGVTETTTWYAAPWHWTLVYREAGNALDHPLAVLIPCPSDLQLAMPIDRELAESLASRKLRRAVQECLSLVRDPFDTRWCVWSVLGSAMVDDLYGLVQIRREYELQPA